MNHPPSLAMLVKMGNSPPQHTTLPLGPTFFAQWASREENLPILFLAPQHLRSQNNTLVADGWRPDLSSQTWAPLTDVPICAIYNRFPRNHAPLLFHKAAELARTHNVPFANCPELQELVWNKWNTHQLFLNSDIPIPEATDQIDSWLTHLQRWKQLYIKPQQGAFGEGICKLTQQGRHFRLDGLSEFKDKPLSSPGLSAWLQRTHAQTPLMLQQGISPPWPSLQGFCIRALTQRVLDLSGHTRWHHAPPVARSSQLDPVANVARGAHAEPLEDLLLAQWGPSTCQALLRQIALHNEQIAQQLLTQLPTPRQPELIELGIDYVLSPQRTLSLLEINGFPQGRLIHLATSAPTRFEGSCRLLHEHPLNTLKQMISK